MDNVYYNYHFDELLTYRDCIWRDFDGKMGCAWAFSNGGDPVYTYIDPELHPNLIYIGKL